MFVVSGITDRFTDCRSGLKVVNRPLKGSKRFIRIGLEALTIEFVLEEQ